MRYHVPLRLRWIDLVGVGLLAGIGFTVSLLVTELSFDATVDAVIEWVAEAKKRGIEIVPVSALAFDPEAR